MTDIIVILVIAVFVLLGVKSTIKHFKGKEPAAVAAVEAFRRKKKSWRIRSSERKLSKSPACTASTVLMQ